jgi:lysophospholipase L1-like esterase
MPRLIRIVLGLLWLSVAAPATTGPAWHPWGTQRVLHFGDSHTGSDALQAVLRDGLHEQFGDGGPGYLLPWLRKRRPGAGASAGWRRLTLAQDPEALLGLGGAALEAARRGEKAWCAGSFSRLRLYLLRQPGGGAVRVSVDGQILGEPALASAQPGVVVLEQAFPGVKPRRIQIETMTDGRSRILGVSLERAGGAVYSPLSVNGAQASWLLRMPDGLLEAQLRPEAPSLIILAFGTNEAKDRDFDGAGYERTLKQVLERLRRAAPLASLLLVAPPDAAFPGEGLDRIAAIQQAQAAALGAGFLDLRAAMGGPGSIRRWLGSGLAQGDLVHFTAKGYDRHARILLPALLQGLAVQPAPAVQPNPVYVYRTGDGRTVITNTIPGILQ